MEHFFGIDIGASLEFQDKIRAIGQQISQKKLARTYFGNRPFVAPEKNLFMLKKDENNEIILVNVEGNAPTINLTVRHNQNSEINFNEITKLTLEICEIICKELGVEIIKIGSVFQQEILVENRFKKFENEFVPSLFPDLTTSGGFARYMYEVTLPEINKECYIHLDIDVNRVEEKILTKLDINNKDSNVGMNPREVLEIGKFSFDFLHEKVKVLLESKGILKDES